MRLLLDTHVALWAITASPRVPRRIYDLIEDPANDVFVSAVTVWEIAIKRTLGRRGRSRMPISGEQAIGFFRQSGYTLLDITAEHAAAVGRLPSHHADPFDRLLIAQALAEPLRLVSHDPMIARYGEMVIGF